MSKFFFGLFMLSLGLATGFLLGPWLSDALREKINPLFLGALTVGIVLITFFIWRLSEKVGSNKTKHTDHINPI
ncbi:MAG: hypothetical protein KatS3mg031_1815 [Chitinophagales bacterium]|nr:MAG: hypothetical protein KatS3mg031_1815 [Chitinophagales bacterium]